MARAPCCHDEADHVQRERPRAPPSAQDDIVEDKHGGVGVVSVVQSNRISNLSRSSWARCGAEPATNSIVARDLPGAVVAYDSREVLVTGPEAPQYTDSSLADRRDPRSAMLTGRGPRAPEQGTPAARGRNAELPTQRDRKLPGVVLHSDPVKPALS